MLNDSRLRNRLKLLYWDGSGLWICAKRLERGKFSWPEERQPSGTASRCVVMSQAELTLLLHGIDLTTTRRRKWYRVQRLEVSETNAVN